MNLLAIEKQYRNYTDKESKHGYISNFYEKLFENYNNAHILEVGIKQGGSLAIWSDYYKNGSIVGLDIDESSIKYELLENENIQIIIGDAYDKNLSNRIGGKFDIIIDDGSHKLEHQQKFLEIYFEKLKKGGVIIVEDVLEKRYVKELTKVINSVYKIVDLSSDYDSGSRLFVVEKE